MFSLRMSIRKWGGPLTFFKDTLFKKLIHQKKTRVIDNNFIINSKDLQMSVPFIILESCS